MGKADVRRLLGLEKDGWTVKVCAQETRTWVATSSDRGSVECPPGTLKLPENVSVILLRCDHAQVAGDASKLSELPTTPINPLGFGASGLLITPLDGRYYTLSGNGERFLVTTGTDFSNILSSSFGEVGISLINGVFSWGRIRYAMSGAWYQNVTNTQRNCAVVQYI